MDLVASCREKLPYFRIKDLKDILTQLAISKQGKKQDLINRILALLSDDQATRFMAGGKRSAIGKEGIAKIIEDTYRKIHFSGATNLASEGPNSEPNDVNSKTETKNTSKVDKNVHCLCGHSLITESMVKCEDPTCQVYQHASCVFVPEKPTEFAQVEIPKHFYCEICRLKRADPFWVAQSHPLLPILLSLTSIAQDGTNNIQTTQRTFQLSRGDKDLLQRAEYDLQVWCILLNDKVPFRMQWPQFTELHVNGVLIRTTSRPGSQPLGANGRDDGPIISRCSQEGINKISLSKSDARVFCFGVRIVRRRTIQQVMSLIPKEAEGESFDNALARICRCVGAGNAMENADSDSDIEVVAESVVVNLRCPMSGARIKTAGRFKPCVHMGCFDLGTFIELNQRSRKWQCPICLKNYSLENVIIDPYFNRITTMLKECEEDVDEIEIKPDGSWRVKSEEYKDLGQWHLPDGSHFVPCSPVKCEPDVFKQSKQDFSDKQDKDLNEFCVTNKNNLVKPSLLINKQDLKSLLPVNYGPQKFGNHNQQGAFMSSSATGSYREGEDSSINQEGGGYFEFSTANAYEFDSGLNFGIAQSSNDMVLPGTGDKDIIHVSDSEEDDATLVTRLTTNFESARVETTASLSFNAVDPSVFGTYSGTHGVGASREPCMELFGNGHDLGTSLWPLSTNNQADLAACNQPSPLEFLAADVNANIENNVTDAHHNTFCWPSTSGSSPATIDGRINALQTGDYLSGHPNPEDSGVLLDNPLAFDADPSLQIFLPTQPLGASVLRNLNAREGIPDCVDDRDWISLRLGDTGLDHGESSSPGGLDLGHPYLSMQNRKDSLADTGSLHLSMNNDDRSTKMVTDFQRSNGPSRSVKPRLSLSIDVNADD